MSLRASRWHDRRVQLQLEREVLEWLREQLPNHDPWHVWTNFEFIDDEGRINEVDALVLAPAQVHHRIAEARKPMATLHTALKTDGREIVDNPRLLTDRKAKRLKKDPCGASCPWPRPRSACHSSNQWSSFPPRACCAT